MLAVKYKACLTISTSTPTRTKYVQISTTVTAANYVTVRMCKS